MTTCPYCQEPIAASDQTCPHCGEGRGGRRPQWLGTLLVGIALGLFLTGAAGRFFSAGPVPEAASVTRSLEFLEIAVAACFLLLLARALERR